MGFQPGRELDFCLGESGRVCFFSSLPFLGFPSFSEVKFRTGDDVDDVGRMI